MPRPLAQCAWTAQPDSTSRQQARPPAPCAGQVGFPTRLELPCAGLAAQARMPRTLEPPTASSALQGPLSRRQVPQRAWHAPMGHTLWSLGSPPASPALLDPTLPLQVSYKLSLRYVHDVCGPCLASAGEL